MSVTVALLSPAERDAATAFYERVLAGSTQARLGELVDLSTLPTLAAHDADRLVGLAAYRRSGAASELVAIAADPPRSGVGTALLEALVRALTGTERLWLVTTNDNLDALRFYQRRGFRLVGVEHGGVDRSRALKPAIPLVGRHGIELHDELILERRLDG